MADTKRTLSALIALSPDNTSGDFSNQDMRDFMVSAVGSRAVAHVAVDTTLTTNHDVLTVDASGGARAVTLPDRAANEGKIYTVKRTSASNDVTVSAAGSDTIEGAASLTLGSQYASVTLAAGTAVWLILATTGTVT